MKRILELINEVKDKRKELKDLELRLSKYTLKDKTLLSRIYSIFVEECHEKDKVKWRKLFLFVVLLLYAPNTLNGAKMPKGLRVAISEYISDIKKSTISATINGIYFNYRLYKDFRAEAERLFVVVVARLEAENLTSL